MNIELMLRLYKGLPFYKQTAQHEFFFLIGKVIIRFSTHFLIPTYSHSSDHSTSFYDNKLGMTFKVLQNVLNQTFIN